MFICIKPFFLHFNTHNLSVEKLISRLKLNIKIKMNVGTNLHAR